MASAFAESADFSGMTDERQLFIGDVVHKTFIALDEAGVEAAAATAVIMADNAVPRPEHPPKRFTADHHPCLFAIRDVPTGALLFYGQLADPAAN